VSYDSDRPFHADAPIDPDARVHTGSPIDSANPPDHELEDVVDEPQDASVADPISPDEDTLLIADNLVKEFPVRGGFFGRHVGKVHAVSGVSLHVNRGETLGIVGESGCGKSTLGRLLLQLLTLTSGTITLGGEDVASIMKRDKREIRKRMQIVFQDPYASLNPRMTVGEIIAEPIMVHGGIKRKSSRDQVGDLLASVGLSPEHQSRYPHEFSGGQRQRIGIARALAVEPELIVLDEPVSALDVSIQAGVVNLLMELQRERNLAYLFIAHDLSVVRHISNRVGVMYLGKMVEIGKREDIYLRPSHPYTKALLSAVPVADPRVARQRKRIVATGEVPSPIDPPSGCRFRTRCWKAEGRCAEEVPLLIDRGAGHPVACHFPEDPEPVIPITDDVVIHDVEIDSDAALIGGASPLSEAVLPGMVIEPDEPPTP